jgi:hypothetical protein
MIYKLQARVRALLWWLLERMDGVPANVSIEDGFGNRWRLKCPKCGYYEMYINRVGDARCWWCENMEQSGNSGELGCE